MKKAIMAISAALLVAALVLTPAMGFTIKSENSPYPFSIGAEAKPAFTVVAGQAAHTINPGAFVSEKAPAYSISTGTPYQYSLTTGKPYQYSIQSGKELAGAIEPVAPVIPEISAAPANDTNVTNETEVVTPEALAPVETTETAEVAETAELAETTEAATAEIVENETVEAVVNVTEPVAPAAPEVPVTYTVSGMVYEDLNASATKDADEMGLANVTVNLAGAELISAVTAEDGSYMFDGVAAGEYMVSVDAVEGWNVPAAVSITVADNVTGVDFALTMVESPVEEPAVVEDVPPVNETAVA